MAEADRSGISEAGSPDRELTSLTLLAKLRNNQQDAWTRLDCLYGPLIHYWCARRGLDLPEIEDIRQQVYKVVFLKIGEFRRDREHDTFRGWLRGVTRMHILAFYRKRGEQVCAEGGTDAGRNLDEIPDSAPADDDEPDEQKAELLHRALEFIHTEFTARDWNVFRLLTIEGKTATEVGKQLDLKPTAARQVKFRILKRVREELGDEDTDPPAPGV